MSLFMAIEGTTLQPNYHIEVLELDGPNREWDSFVLAHPHGDLVQTSVWGLSKRSIGQTPRLITLRDKASRSVGGMLLIERRLGFWMRVGYVARGPLALGDDLLILRTALDAACACMRKRKLVGLIVQLSEGSELRDKVLDDAGFMDGGLGVAPEATIRVDVTQTDDSILSAMSKSRRGIVRNSMKKSFEIEHSSDVETFYRLHLATGTRAGFTELSLEYLNAQWQALAPSGYVTILLARHQGKAMAGLWLSHFGEVVTLRLSGWDAAVAGPAHVNEAIHWAAIQWARSVGARICDFGGFDRDSAERVLSGRPLTSDFVKSRYYFKLSFNGVPTLLPKPHFLVANRVASRLTRWLAAALLQSPQVRKIAQRLRS